MKLDEMVFVANQANQFREFFEEHCCNSNDVPSIDFFIEQVCSIMKSDTYNRKFHEKVYERKVKNMKIEP